MDNKKESKGNGDGEFTIPYSVDVDSKGDIGCRYKKPSVLKKLSNDRTVLLYKA